MKNISIKNIIINVIGALAVILLVVGLAFSVAMENAEYVNTILPRKFSGFEALSFTLPNFVKNNLAKMEYESGVVTLFGILFGSFSVLALIVAVVGALLLTYLLLTKSNKCFKGVLILTICGLVVTLAYAITSIIIVGIWNKDIINVLLVKHDVYSTYIWVPVIFQAVCLIGVIICYFCVKDKEISFGSDDKPAVKRGKESVIELLKEEAGFVKLLKDYHNMFKKELLSEEEFLNKKNRILTYSQTVIYPKIILKREKLVVGKSEAETAILELIKEYKALVTAEIITEDEYLLVKGALLGSVL